MLQSVLDYIYEGFYSARILTGAFIAAHFLLKRRYKSLLPAIISFIVTVLCAASFSIILSFLQNAGYSRNFITIINGVWYCGLLLVLYGVVVLNFKGNLSETLFVFACGVLMESMAFGLFRITYDLGIFTLRVNTVASEICDIAITVVLYTAFVFVFKRLFKNTDKLNAGNSLSLVYLLVIAVGMFLRLGMQGIYEYVNDTSHGWIDSVTLIIVPLVFMSLILLVARVSHLSYEKNTLEGMLDEKERQYRMSSDSVEIINRKCHDIKRQLRAFEFVGSGDRARAIAEMEKTINIYDSFVKTSCPALNTILSEKTLFCNDNGISLTCNVRGDNLNFIAPVDIYVLMSNIIDNAIEAVINLKNDEKKIITLNIYTAAGVLCIVEDNYFDGKISFEGGLPQTRKADKSRHGFGVKSIRHIAEKYGGSAAMQSEGEVFTVSVTIPVVEE